MTATVTPGTAWAAVPGFPGYEATPDGRVRSWWKAGGRGNRGRRGRRERPRELRGTIKRTRYGGRVREYRYFALIDDRGRRHATTIESLIRLTFGDGALP